MKKEDANLHWSQYKEKTAGYWLVKFLLILFKIFPVIVLRVIAFPVGFFYFIFSKKARTESRRFLQTVAPFAIDSKTTKKCRSRFGALRHIVSFSLTLIEKLETWAGKFPFKAVNFQDDDINCLIQDMENGRGVFVLTSHMGNVELLRGLASFSRTGVSKKVPVTAIFDVKVSENFTRMLNELNPQSSMDIISVTDIGAHTAAILDEKLEKGEIVTIAGDRTSALSAEKNLMIPFLGKNAPFSPGAFYMAVLLKAPVYFITALRKKDLSLKPQYDMFVRKSPLRFECGKKERPSLCAELARSYVNLLESYCKEKPFQWYNFYDFWLEE